MEHSQTQRTIARPARVDGIGYWSGRSVRVEFHPAPAGSGLAFVRTDLPDQPRIPATVAHRTEADRRTNLCEGSATVDMVEHVLAALAGLGIDNCEIRVNEPEMPGGDGSSLAFVQAIQAAGFVDQNAPRRPVIIRQTVRLEDGPCWIEARPSPDCQTILDYELDFGPGNAIGHQKLSVALQPAVFAEEIAPARTFLLRHEAEAIQSRGLALWASAKDLLVFGDEGPIDNVLRFPDECVRHKLLDLVGDLALAGCRLVGHFVAHRSGHRLNAALVRAVLAETEKLETERKCA